MAMNNHFAAVGEEPKPEEFDHGIQVIDEDKSFSCVSPGSCYAYRGIDPLLTHLQDTSQ